MSAALVTLDEVKEHLGLTGTSVHDSDLDRARKALLTNLARRGYTATTEAAEDYEAPQSDTLILRRHPVSSVASVVVYSGGVGTSYTAFDPTASPTSYAYRLDGNLLRLTAGVWPQGATVRVTYSAGYSDDADLKYALLEGVRMWFSDLRGVGSDTYREFADDVTDAARPRAGLHPWIEQNLPPRAPSVA